MRTTRAYIASAGTAVTMLGASLCVFALLSAYLAFGSWPGAQSNTSVDQIVLRSVQRAPHASKVTVRADAVAIARRAAARAQRLGLAGSGPAVTGIPGARVVTGVDKGATQLASTPGSAGGGSGGGGGSNSVDKVKKTLTDTTNQTTTQVQTDVQNVQDQVNDVVGGIGGPTPDTTPTTPGDPVQQTKDSTGSVLGH